MIRGILAALLALALLGAAPVVPDVVMMQAVFRITGPSSKAQRKITGTGFLVYRTDVESGENEYIAITAAHVLRDITGNRADFLIPMIREDGQIDRVFLAMPIRQQGEALWTEVAGADVAAMRVPLPASRIRPLAFDTLASDEDVETRLGMNVGAPVHALSYPFGYEFNGFPAVRSAVISSYPLAPASAVKRFVVDFMAFGGDSGGPVYMGAGADVKVLGVVTQQILSPDREENTGLTYVAPAQFAREAIEQMGR